MPEKNNKDIKGDTVSDLITRLMNFGFTKTDALVYINLLKNGRSSGYKIAKDISLSRSSVYSSIDSLYKNGYIFMSDGTTKEYEAKSPELIFNQIEKDTVDHIQVLKKELARMMLKEDKEFIYNVSGNENQLQKVKEMIDFAQVEIYLNTDFNLDFVKQELLDAVERGVRIIVFSFNKIAVPHPKIEVYSRSEVNEADYPSRRFMFVADMKQVIVFDHRNESVGLYSNNRLMVQMTAEHIHSDIYLTEYEAQGNYQKVRLGTIHELSNNLIAIEEESSL